MKIGACIYCGQTYQVNVEGMSEEELNSVATEMCDCAEAVQMVEAKKSVTAAEKEICELFEEHESVKKLLLAAVEDVQNERVGKVSIGCYGMKASMCLTGKGKLRIARTDTDCRSKDV